MATLMTMLKSRDVNSGLSQVEHFYPPRVTIRYVEKAPLKSSQSTGKRRSAYILERVRDVP